MTFAWICAALLAAAPASDPASDPAQPPDPALSYRELRDKAGRSPEEQVRLALWCETHNLPAERLHHLTLAVLADPRNAVARALMGLVARDGRWLRPEAVADRLKADPDRAATLAEYEARRQRAAYTADGQWALGVWADEQGLAEQARAHLTAVTRLDPSRDAAWKRLGFKSTTGGGRPRRNWLRRRRTPRRRNWPIRSGSRCWRSGRGCWSSPRSARRPRRRWPA